MRKSLVFTVLLFFVDTGSVRATGADASLVEADCDITGTDLRTSKEGSAEDCSKACESDGGCRGWSFISGWNKCFLKSNMKSKTKVRMYAGIVDRSKNPAVVLQDGWQKDNSGKDFRRIAPLKDHRECSTECINDERCKAFVFIEGYQVCWLKQSAGRMYDKVFSCGKGRRS